MDHYWLKIMMVGMKKIKIKEKGKTKRTNHYQNRKRNKGNLNLDKNHFLNPNLLIEFKDRHNHYNHRMFLIPTNKVKSNKITLISKMRIGLWGIILSKWTKD